jgi:hypothetical protein
LLSFSPKSFVFPSHIKKLKIKIYRTVIFPVVLYGCEIWYLTLGEEHRLRVFENSVLRICGPKREEDGSWKKLHNDEHHNLYSSQNFVNVINSRRMRWAGRVARMGEERSVYSVLVGSCEGKRPLGRLGVGEKITLRCNLRGSMERIGFGWLRIRSSGGLV